MPLARKLLTKLGVTLARSITAPGEAFDTIMDNFKSLRGFHCLESEGLYRVWSLIAIATKTPCGSVIRFTSLFILLFIASVEFPAEVYGQTTASNTSVQIIDLPVEDLLYESNSRLIYASVSDIGGSISNSIVAINPDSGVVSSAVYVGPITSLSPSKFRSGRLAMSDDHQYLYVAISNATSIRQYGIATHTPGPIFPVGLAWFNGGFNPLSVADLKVLPGHPATVIVARANGSQAKGVAIYDSGVQRPDTASEYGDDIYEIEPSANGLTLYGYEPFWRMSITPSGVSKVDGTYGLISGSDMKLADGLIYSSGGPVLDPSSLTVVGNLGSGSFVVTDSSLGRVFVMSYPPGAYVIQAFDAKTFIPLKSLSIPRDNYVPRRIIRFGTNGLAFTTSANKIYLIRSSLLTPAGPPVDLNLAQARSGRPIAGEPLTFTMTVANTGAVEATDVVLQDTSPGNCELISASISQGNYATTDNRITCNLGALPVGSNATLTMVVQPVAAGWITNTASCAANELDPNLANNVSAMPLFVEIPSFSNSVNQLNIPTEDIIYDAGSGLIYATTSSNAVDVGNRLVAIDPHSAVIVSSFSVGDQPEMLAVSDDYHYLYIATESNQSVRRMDLWTQTTEFAVSLGLTSYGLPFALGNMRIIPGDALSLAVLRLQPAYSGPNRYYYNGDVAILSNGSILSNTVPLDRGNSFMDVGSDGASLYGMFSYHWDFSRLAIDSSGIALVDTTPDLIPPADLQVGGGLIYTTLGSVLDPTTKTVIRTIPGISAGSLVTYDKMNSRIFYLVPNGTNWTLQQFDALTSFPLGFQSVSGILGSPANLIRWGEDGIAFRTTSSQLFIIRTTIFPIPPAVDLSVAISQTPGPAVVGGKLDYSVSIFNNGPNVAFDVALTNHLPDNSSIIAFNSSQGTCSNSGRFLICSLGQLANGAMANVTFTVQPQSDGVAVCTASAGSAGMDITTFNDSASALSLVQPTSGFGSVSLLSLPTKDILIEPRTQTIYASIPSTAAGIGDALLQIDPAAGTIRPPIPIGSDPGKLAISKDSALLYVALDGADAVRRFDISSQMADLQFSLGKDRKVIEMLVLPDHPESVVIYRTYDQKVAIYDNGVKRPVEIGGINVMAFSDTSALLYGNDDYYSTTPLYQLAIGSNGISLIDPQPAKQWSAYMRFDLGLLYYSAGRVLDPVSHRVAGTFSIEPGSLILPEAASGRLFCLSPDLGHWDLKAFDLATFLPVGDMSIPGINGTPSSLLRWGTNGLAFRTSSNQLFLIRTPLVPTTFPTDLAIAIDASPSSVELGGIVTYDVTVSNKGPSPAHNLKVNQTFSSGVSNVTIISAQGVCISSNGTLDCSLGTLASGENTRFTVRASPTEAGTLTMKASTSSDSRDPQTGNNTAVKVTLVSLPGTINAIVQISLATKDLVYDPRSKKIYATIPGSVPDIGNSIIGLDPGTIQFGSPLLVGSEPGKLALSDDGEALYTALDGAMGIRRVSLPEMTANLEFPFSLDEVFIAADIQVQPGHPNVVAASLISLRTSGDYPENVSIFDHGYARSNRTDRYSSSKPLAFSADGTKLYGFITFGAGYGFLRLLVTDSEISLLDINHNLSSDNDLKFDKGLIYSSSGIVFDPELATPLGTNQAIGLVRPDSSIGRVFYLTQVGVGWELRAFDQNTFQPIGTTAIPGIAGVPSSLIRCGEDRVAFRTSAGQLFILRTGLTLPVVRLQPSGDDIYLSFATITGKIYQVERCSNLSDNSWTTLVPSLNGTGGIMQFRDVEATHEGKLFYRVRASQ